jgi:uncharacterized damage-inducible protein DinB
MNLTEAFRALDALNEDTFSVSDNGIQKLSEFEQNDDLIDDIEVIDPEADTEEDLSDSYIGKVILDCSVCHSKLYKDVSEVNVDEEAQLANVGEECPYCYTSEGFKVIDEVAAYEEASQEESREEAGAEDLQHEEPEVEESEEEIKESLDESLNEGPATTLDRTMTSITGTLGNVLAAHADEVRNIRSKEDALVFLDSIEDEVSDKDYLATVKSNMARKSPFQVIDYLYSIILAGENMRKSGKRHPEEESLQEPLTESYEDVDGIMGEKGTKWTEDQLRTYFDSEKDNDPVLKAYNGNADKWLQDTLKGMTKVNEGIFDFGKKKAAKKEQEKKAKLAQQQANRDRIAKEQEKAERERGQRIAQDWKEREDRERNAKAEYNRSRYNSIKGDKPSNTGYRGVNYSGGDYYESLGESVKVNGENLSYAVINPDGSYAGAPCTSLEEARELAAQKEGRVVVTLEAVKNESKSVNESVNNVNVETDDSIVNVSTDDNGKVTVTTEPNEAPAEAGEEVIAPVSSETETEIMNNNSEKSEEGSSAEGSSAEGEELDLDVEEFDEESFDELGESYLRNIYENVESYKTVDVASSKNKIQVEGIIKFNSGNEKKTSFIFEAKDCNKKGKVRFIGENTQITRGKKAFTVAGHLTEGKFITESFRYNYKVKDDEGKSTRVYGTVKR